MGARSCCVSSDPASWPCLGSLSLRGARVGGGQTPARRPWDSMPRAPQGRVRVRVRVREMPWEMMSWGRVTLGLGLSSLPLGPGLLGADPPLCPVGTEVNLPALSSPCPLLGCQA